MKKRIAKNTPLSKLDEIARIDRDGEFVFPPYTRDNRPETEAEAARSGRPIRLVGIYADNTRGDVLQVWRVNGEEKRTPMCVESAARLRNSCFTRPCGRLSAPSLANSWPTPNRRRQSVNG